MLGENDSQHLDTTRLLDGEPSHSWTQTRTPRLVQFNRQSVLLAVSPQGRGTLFDRAPSRWRRAGRAIFRADVGGCGMTYVLLPGA